MRILYLTNSPYLGGTGRILQSWIQGGRERGVRGYLVLQKPGDLVPWAQAEGVDALLDPMPWPERRRPFRSLWHVWRVARWARKFKIDLIHCNEHDVYPFALALRRLLRCPIVCHVRYRLSRGFADWVFAGKRAPAALLWTSHTQKADSAEAVDGTVPEDRQHVVRLGVDLTRFGRMADVRDQTRAEWGIQPHEILIGTASPLRARKKVEDFVRLIAELSHGRTDLAGLIAGGTVPGEEAYRDGIQRQIAAAGLGRRLRWIGYLEPIEPFYHACDILVSTSEYETFGNSVCEAMACGKPVIGYHGGSVQEIIGDAGVVVDTDDFAGLLAGTERLLDDTSLRLELGEKARRRVAECFDPAGSFAQLQEIYQRVLGR